MKTTYTIDMDVAKDELSKEELQILNILIGKIQDADVSCTCDDEYYIAHYEDDDYEPTPPPAYKVSIWLNQQDSYQKEIPSYTEEGAVFEWYKQNNLDGKLVLNKAGGKDVWYYNGFKVQLERV